MKKPHGNTGRKHALRGAKPLGAVIGIRAELEFRESARAASKAAKMTLSQWCLEALEEKLERDKIGIIDDANNQSHQPKRRLIMKTRNDISLGYTRDSAGNMLAYKDSEGYWREYTYDAQGNELACKTSSGYWQEYTRDAAGKVLTHKTSDGYWREYTCDAQGNELSYKDSTGCWQEYTRDAAGKVLTHKDSNGYWREYTRDAAGNVLSYKDSTSNSNGGN